MSDLHYAFTHEKYESSKKVLWVSYKDTSEKVFPTLEIRSLT